MTFCVVVCHRVSLGIVVCHWVLSCVEHWVLSCVVGYCRVLNIGYRRVSLGIIVCYWVSSCVTGYCRVLNIGYCRVSLGIVVCCWVLSCVVGLLLYAPNVEGKWVDSNFQIIDLLVQPRAAGVAGTLILFTLQFCYTTTLDLLLAVFEVTVYAQGTRTFMCPSATQTAM